MEHADLQGRVPSLLEVLHEAPSLLEALPSEACKSLSATCRSLRTSFCAKVRIIWVSDAKGASKLCCTVWPNLLMVVCTPGFILASNLKAHWDVMMEISLCDVQDQTAVLVRSYQGVRPQLMDLPYQHSAALSNFADKHRRNAITMTLRGPLVRCGAVRLLMLDCWPTLEALRVEAVPQLEAESMSHFSTSLPNLASLSIKHCCPAALELSILGLAWPQLSSLNLSHNQLDANFMSIMPQARWTHLHVLELDSNMISAAGIQHLVACSLPLLEYLQLSNTGVDEPALCYLAKGQWPSLYLLDLTHNNIGAKGISYLVQGCWPSLASLFLSKQGLDEEVCSLLGIEYPEKSIFEAVFRKSGLHQFPYLRIYLCNR